MPLGLKIFLLVLAAVAVLLILAINLVLFLRIKIKIGLKDKITFRLYVGGVRVLSLPRPPKKLRHLRTYTKKRAMKAAAKQSKHIEDHLESVRSHPLYKVLMKKYAESKAKKKKPAPKTDAPKKKKQTQTEDSLDVELLMTLLAEILEAILDGTHKGVRVHLCKLHVDVVGADAAATAIITGALWASLANLLGVLDRLTRLRVGSTDVSIVPDYTGEKTRVEFALSMSCNLYRALGIVLPMIPIVLKHRNELFGSSKDTPKTA